MRIVVQTVIITLISILAVTGCSASPESAISPPEQQPLVVFLVRHSEKVESDSDPGLSAAGRERVAELVDILRDAEIEFVHSSDYNRTRESATPIADAQGLDVTLYDPRDLPGLAEQLRNRGGRHLVVGHSNTTPELARLLGGDPGSAIDDKSEYDRLYIVTIGKGGAATSVMLRYGAPPD